MLRSSNTKRVQEVHRNCLLLPVPTVFPFWIRIKTEFGRIVHIHEGRGSFWRVVGIKQLGNNSLKTDKPKNLFSSLSWQELNLASFWETGKVTTYSVTTTKVTPIPNVNYICHSWSINNYVSDTKRLPYLTHWGPIWEKLMLFLKCVSVQLIRYSCFASKGCPQLTKQQRGEIWMGQYLWLDEVYLMVSQRPVQNIWNTMKTPWLVK